MLNDESVALTLFVRILNGCRLSGNDRGHQVTRSRTSPKSRHVIRFALYYRPLLRKERRRRRGRGPAGPGLWYYSAVYYVLQTNDRNRIPISIVVCGCCSFVDVSHVAWPAAAAWLASREMSHN